MVPASDWLSAQLLAILRQVEITATRTSVSAIISTESEEVIACLCGKAEPSSPEARRLLTALAGQLRDLDGKAEVGLTDRKAARAAFIAARQTRKAWLAGAKGEPGTWAAPAAAVELRSAA